MKRVIIASIVSVAVAVPMLPVNSFGADASLPDNLVQVMTDAIKKHCPEAKIEFAKGIFTAKHGTMTFTMHSISKTGEVSPETYQQEGPNFKGFILQVARREGEYQGAAKVPQTIQEPYFQTHVDAPATADGKGHYQIHFSYGSRLDPELKKAIFAVLPNADTEKRASAEADKQQRLPEKADAKAQ